MKQLLDIFAMLLIGDGLLSAINPRRHCLLWEVGPEPCRKLIDEFAEHPQLTRGAGALELLLGLWLASHEENDSSLFGRFGL
jgi:hypothetical protein